MKSLLLFLHFNYLIYVCETIKLPPYSQSNCVQSLFCVLQKSTNITFSKQDKKEIYIAYDNIDYLFSSNSPKLKGVVYNLVKHGHAVEINRRNLKKGDIIQFWNGHYGHCGIFHSIKDGKMYLWSSYPSTNWSVSSFSFPSTLYACRIKPIYFK